MSRFLSKAEKGSELLTKALEPVDLDGGYSMPSLLTRSIQDVKSFIDTGPPITLDAVPAFVDALKNMSTAGLDDRKFLLEKVLTLMARLPADSQFSASLQHFVIDILYKDLPHPPSGYLSLPTENVTSAQTPNSRVKYAFRSADGSNYTPLVPGFGQARTPYARSVPSVQTTPVSALPDAGLLFDTLLKREAGTFTPHPDGISSFFFAFADLIIHCIFRTNHKDYTINDVSSYLDLSVLYGSNEWEVDTVRRKDGTGRLWDDTFADSRVLYMPPSVCALLVLFCRNHNFVAEKILSINERGTFSPPSSLSGDEDKILAQDDEIFQRARLVNCALFMKIILGDYVGAILGLTRDGLSWRLDPLATIRDLDHEFSPQGQGNVCSIEFNLLYRWHATVSEGDAKWTEDEFARIFGTRDFSTITVHDFISKAATAMVPPDDIKTWTFGGLQRDAATGRFPDGDLANILQNATEWSAASYGARGTPEVLRVIEMLSIEQSRSWGACSLNEFRKFMGLKQYANFKEWNPDPSIHNAAEALYGHIDNLELHVGMQAEQSKVPMPGAGLCPGYTISRAILADAVCLTRGDRFLTVDLTPFNLTSWGYQDVQFDADDGSFSGMLPKLLFRTLPDHYPSKSAYAHFPFLVPATLRKKFAAKPESIVGQYVWTRPPVPKTTVRVQGYNAAAAVLGEPKVFESGVDRRTADITRGQLLYKQVIQKALFSEQNISAWTHAFQCTAGRLIKQKSITHVGSDLKYVDIVKDVVNLLPVYWLADEIVGLSLKSKINPWGIYRDQEVYEQFAIVSNYVLMNTEAVDDWSLHQQALDITDTFTGLITGHLNRLSGSLLSVSVLTDTVKGLFAGQNNHENSDAFLRQLLTVRRTHPPSQISASLFAEVVPTTAVYAKAVAHIVNFYLDDERARERADIAVLAAERTPEAERKIMRYAREAIRLDPPISGIVRTAKVDTRLGTMPISAGDNVVASIIEANNDKAVFGPNPEKPSFDRTAVEAFGLMGITPQGLLQGPFFENTVPAILGVIFSLRDLKRAPGKSGQLNRFTQTSPHGYPEEVYVNSQGQLTPWPSSLVVQYTPTA